MKWVELLYVGFAQPNDHSISEDAHDFAKKARDYQKTE
jgi:hypothetical protein